MAVDTNCPNCGHHDYKEKDPCDSCGFLKPNPKKLAEAILIFCTKCGCHYTTDKGVCPLHDAEYVTAPHIKI
jgi:ribosomal protein L37E